MSLYIKVLTDYYHLLVGDLEEERAAFLENFLDYLLAKDDYGYDPVFEGEVERAVKLLKRIHEKEAPMTWEAYLELERWHREDGWSDGELQEYFLHQRKEKEIRLMLDFDNATEEEIDILDGLEKFLAAKGREAKVLNIHNARYVPVRDLVQEWKLYKK